MKEPMKVQRPPCIPSNPRSSLLRPSLLRPPLLPAFTADPISYVLLGLLSLAVAAGVIEWVMSLW